MLDGGLDWLQRSGFRTVLFLRRPGEDESADRKQAEKRGMTFLSLEIAADTLGPDQVKSFRETVSDVGKHPLFVYDRDGSLAGGMWYLYLRTAEILDHEAALLRARALGLREGGDAQREMWLAVQNYLSRHGE